MSNNLDQILQKAFLAHQDGNLIKAEKFYRRALKVYPNHPDVKHNLAIVIGQIKLNELVKHYNAQNWVEALTAGKLLIQQFPKSPVIANILGAANHRLGHLEEAIYHFRMAVDLQPNNIEAHNNLGIALNELSRNEEAVAVYTDALKLDQNNEIIHNHLGNAFNDLGYVEKAISSCTRAIELKPDYFEAHYKLGNIQRGNGKLKDAAGSYETALEINPTYDPARYHLGNALSELGDYKEASQHFNLTNYGDSKINDLECIYITSGPENFSRKFEKLKALGTCSPLLGSLVSHAAIRYGMPDNNPFCSHPLDYVYHSNLTIQNGLTPSLIEEIRTHAREDKRNAKTQGLLTNGSQTFGNLFLTEKPFILKIQQIIDEQIQKYLDKYKDKNQGFITNWPKNFKLYGWLVSIRKGGHLAAHMHKEGWLSGSLYLNIPAKTRPNDGNIVFSLHSDKYPNDNRIYPTKMIDINLGDICLFPSSLFHYTLPFESQEDRISLAFDIIPIKNLK